jgi:protein gp37
MIHGVDAPPLDWVIVGCESGPDPRPCDPSWVRSIIGQCEAADVPVFVKQWQDPVSHKLVKMPVIDGKVYAQMPRVKT